MNKLKAMNAAANRFFSRFSRRQFFLAFVVVTAVNYWLAYNVSGYKSVYLAMVGGFFFGMMFAKFEPDK
jgi:Na+/melibiose symporter-like transporter